MHGELFLRNVILLAFIASPLAVVVVSVWSALSLPHITEKSVVCWVLIALAFVVTLMNAHLSFIRPMLYAKLHDNSLEGYRFVSGIPLVGSVLATIAVLVAWGQLPVALVSLLLLLTDTGGVVCLLVALCRDKSFWAGRI